MPRMNVRPRPSKPEAGEQNAGVQLLRFLKAAVYVSGTRRPKGEYQGTRQTPGIPDVMAILPNLAGVVFWEAKASGGRMSPEQLAFRVIVEQYEEAGLPVYHVLGGSGALVALLLRLGLVKADQVPHYRLVPVNKQPDVGVRPVWPSHLDPCANPAALQVHFELLGKQARAKRRTMKELLNGQ